MSKPFQWSSHPEIGSFVLQHYPRTTSGELASAIYERFQVYLSPSAIRNYYCLHSPKEATPPLQPPQQPEEGARFPDRRIGSDEDVLELYDLAMQQVERAEAAFAGQTQATVDFSKESKPIGICFTGDWQIGAKGVLMRQLLKDTQTIQDTEGLYCFAMGDLIQNLNQRKHPQGLHDCVLPSPEEQEECALYLLKKVQSKLLGLVTGNHEENSKQASGITLTKRWATDLNVPYFWHGALVHILVGHQKYKLGLRHKFKNESSVNTTNAQRMIHQQLWPDADAIVMGDKHYNDMQMVSKPLGDVVFLRCGSYLRMDDYAQGLGGYRGSVGIPMLIFYPETRHFLPFFGKSFSVALQVLQDQRARYS